MKISEIIKLGQDTRSSKVDQIDFILFQKISPYFTKIFLIFKLTPNQITTLGLLLIFLASILIITDNKINIFLASILTILYLIFDYSDGEIARIKKQQTMSGTYLDFVVDYIVYALVLGSLSVIYLKYNSTLYSNIIVIVGISSTLLRGIINLMISHVIVTESIRLNNRVEDGIKQATYVSLFKTEEKEKEKNNIKNKQFIEVFIKFIKISASAFHGNQIFYIFFIISFIQLFFTGWNINNYFLSPLSIYILLIFVFNPIIILIKIFEIIFLKQVEKQYKKFNDARSTYSSKSGGHLK